MFDIGIIAAIVGCAVGAAGWAARRDKQVKADGEWRGSVNTKLDDIKSSVCGMNAKLEKLDGVISAHNQRLTAVESSTKQAHRRIDRLDKLLECNDERKVPKQ